MTALVAMCCIAWTLEGLQSPAPDSPPGPAPADVVSSLETVMTGAIARAEPSVVAIHRQKAENTQETMAVRGRRPTRLLQEPVNFDGRFPPFAGSR